MATEKRYTRKEFVRVGAARAGVALADLLLWGAEALGVPVPAPKVAVPPLSWVRPPGAISPVAFLEACSRCDDCVKACPHWVIRKAGPELGERIQGSPIIVPHENACLMCEDFPCIAACETGALVQPADGARPVIGLAHVDSGRCYMAKGQPCDYCTVHCPEDPKAILASTVGKAAEVLEDACTGCGKCAQICPPRAITIFHPEPTGGPS